MNMTKRNVMEVFCIALITGPIILTVTTWVIFTIMFLRG